MIPKKYEVGERITLRVCNTDRFKSGMLSVSAVLPIERESVWMTLLMLSVLRRGTQKYPTLAALNRRLDYLYGTELSIRNIYRGDCQVIGFSVDILGNAVLPEGQSLMADVLDVVREILFAPLLDENGLLNARYVESEKKHHCDSIRALKNNPRAYAAERCGAILYENEPCGVDSYGKEEDVMAVTPSRLTAHWRKLVESLHLDCFYVGAEDAGSICEALDHAFGDLLSSSSSPRCDTMPTVIRYAEQVKRVEEELPVGQSHLVMGLRTGIMATDSDYFACAVFNEMLGSSPISRLFVHVREKLSLCYFCASRINAYKGTMMIHCGLDKSNRERAEQEILAQLRALAEGDFTDPELEAAKKSLRNAYRQIEDSPGALENFYYGRSLLGIEISVTEFRKGFEKVTRQEVIAAAKAVTLDTVYFLQGTLDKNSAEEEDDEDN